MTAQPDAAAPVTTSVPAAAPTSQQAYPYDAASSNAHVGGAHPRKLAVPMPLTDEASSAMRYQSPLRYPGAKSGLANVIADLITSAARKLGTPELFVEPFAGGASTGLRLAGTGVVRRVLLADADPLVARFWQVAAADTEWLIDRMMDEPVTLERWDHWRNWHPSDPRDRDTAVRCLFLNRTTFSGILHGRAGPIGGRKQESDYKIDCRFNKEALAARLRYVGDLYASNRLADVWCKDWKDTLDDVAEWYPQLIPNQVIAYLDPPYWSKSSKLYRRSFDPAGGYPKPSPLRSVSPLEGDDWLGGLAHHKLAWYLRHEAQVRWILSYDDHPDLTQEEGLYAARRMSPSRVDSDRDPRQWRITKRLVDLRYSAAATAEYRGKREELLITTLPPSCVPLDGRFRSHSSDMASTGGQLGVEHGDVGGYRRPDLGTGPAKCLPRQAITGRFLSTSIYSALLRNNRLIERNIAKITVERSGIVAHTTPVTCDTTV